MAPDDARDREAGCRVARGSGRDLQRGSRATAAATRHRCATPHRAIAAVIGRRPARRERTDARNDEAVASDDFIHLTSGEHSHPLDRFRLSAIMMMLTSAVAVLITSRW